MITPHRRSRDGIRLTHLIIPLKKKLMILSLRMQRGKIGRIKELLRTIRYYNRKAVHMLMMHLLLIGNIPNKLVNILLRHIHLLTEQEHDIDQL